MYVLPFGIVLVFLTAVAAVDKPDQGGPVELFLDEELKLINKYRLMHAAPPVLLSLTLTNKAELWATELANEDKEKLDVNSKFGQAIFSTKLKDVKDVVPACVHSWYNQMQFYDYHSAKGSVKSAYFTQLVWLEAKEVGIGKATSASGKTYVVALFDPPGNKGNFLHYVLPVTGSGVGKKGPSKCGENGFKYFNNTCYKFFPGPENWRQAAEKCTAEFSTMSSIVSPAEDYFQRSLLTSAGATDAWVGTSDVSNHGVMSWLDGSPSNYMNLDYTQQTGPGRKCGVISTTGYLQYHACDGAKGFICKRPLRGLSSYGVVIRYLNKLWTDTLNIPGSPRYQALKRHIEEAVLGVYGDFDWFEQVTVDHFSEDDQGKIIAFVKLRFTPDDDSPVDPIQILRDSIQGSDSSKRTLVTGSLHGEKVRLLNSTLMVENQTPSTCPNYCAASQCMPTTCSPWCCDAFSKQYFPNSFGGQPQPQPGYYNQANQVPAYPQQNVYPMRPPNPYPVPGQQQYPAYPPPQPQYLAPPRSQQYPVPSRPQQYLVPPRPQPYQYPVPPRPQPYQYPVPPRPQPYQPYQVPPRPQPFQYPRPPPPQNQFPQAYQAIARPVIAPQLWYMPPQPQPYYQPAPPVPPPNPDKKEKGKKEGANKAKGPVQLQGIVTVGGYVQNPPMYQPPPRPMYGFYMPQQFYPAQLPQQRQNTKQKEKGAAKPAAAKPQTVQIQGMVLPQGYSAYPPPQVYQPVQRPMYAPPQPWPVYMPQPAYYQPAVTQHPQQRENTKGKEKSHAAAGHEKPPQGQVQAASAWGYPYLGSAPQPYPQPYPQPFRQPLPPLPYPNPNPLTTAPTSWRIKIYRPLIAVPRPAPVPGFNPGYPPLGQRYQYQPNRPMPGYPVQTPMNQYRPSYPYPVPNPYAAAQIHRSPFQEVQKILAPKTCPAPCPDLCAPQCTPDCCKDR